MKYRYLLGMILGSGFYAMIAGEAEAGAWNQHKGDGLVILTSFWTDGSSVFNADGNAIEIPNFTKTESRIYTEYGLTSRWTLTGNAAYQTIGFQGLQSEFLFKDFDETEFGLQYQLKRKRGQAISVRASYIWDGGPLDNILDIGPSRDVVELRGLWGQSWEMSWGDVFTDVQLAGRMETGGRYQSTSLDATIGYKPSSKWLIMIQNYARRADAEEALGFRVPARSYLKTHASITYKYKRRTRLQLGYIETLWGETIVAEQGVSLGVWWTY